ncbi:FAD-dependent oxidoreductase [Clostridiaceae bacterium 35-E11]
MKSIKATYVIIGNGIAGLSAAEEIRKTDSNATIKIISQEAYLTYYRVKLSHFISKDPELKQLLIHDENWYKERNIEIILGRRVENIDPIQSTIQLDNGEQVIYEKLLIANGSKAFVPPVEGVEKEGVYTLRSLEDLKEIQSYLKDCKEVAVIGGGLLGLEAAWALQERDLKVNVIEFFDYLLPRQLDQELSSYVKEELEARKLNIHLSAAAQELVGDEKVTSVRIKDGRNITADMVLFSAGIRPNLEIVEGTDIQINKGIIVDGFMQTSVKNIYAAGDIAEMKGSAMGLWSVAMEQGKVAGKNMVGNAAMYAPIQPATMLSIGGLSLFSAGEINAEKKTLTYRNQEIFHKLFVEEGKLVGGVLTGDVKKMAKLKKAVNDKVEIQGMIEKGMNALEIIGSL